MLKIPPGDEERRGAMLSPTAKPTAKRAKCPA